MPKEIRYISPYDPAVNAKESRLKGRDGYEGTLDHKHIKCWPGMSPVVFVLRTLDLPFRLWVLGADGYEQRIRACEVGLVAIEGYEPWGAGKVWRGTGKFDAPSGKRDILTREEVELVEDEFGHGILGEILAVLLHEVDKGKGWGREKRPYTLPQYVWAEVVETERQRAG